MKGKWIKYWERKVKRHSFASSRDTALREELVIEDAGSDP